MAIDRGKQFEYAIMKSAYSNIKNPTLTEQGVIDLARMKGVEQQVQDVADEMMFKIQGNLHLFNVVVQNKQLPVMFFM